MNPSALDWHGSALLSIVVHTQQTVTYPIRARIWRALSPTVDRQIMAQIVRQDAGGLLQDSGQPASPVWGDLWHGDLGVRGCRKGHFEITRLPTGVVRRFEHKPRFRMIVRLTGGSNRERRLSASAQLCFLRGGAQSSHSPKYGRWALTMSRSLESPSNACCV